MKLTAANVALFLTMTNAQQHYARAARDFFRAPTPERKEFALRKGQLFYGHLRAFRALQPTREGYQVVHAHDQHIGWRTWEEAVDYMARQAQMYPQSYRTAKVVKIREVES